MNDPLEQILAIASYLLNVFVSFATIYFQAILATIIFILGYKLLRVGLDRVPSSLQRSGQYAKFIVPGAVFTLVGTILLASGDPLLAVLFLLTLTVAAGFGFVGLGYRLLLHGVFKADDPDVWSDGKALIGRAAPGVLFAIIGVITITNSLGSAPDMLRERNLERRETTQQIVDVVDSRLSEALTLFRQYVEEPTEEPTEE